MATSKNRLKIQDKLGVWLWGSIFKVAVFFLKPHKVKFPGSKQEFSYGNHPDERLDCIKPPKSIEGTQELAPIVYFHGGGGWQQRNV